MYMIIITCEKEYNYKSQNHGISSSSLEIELASVIIYEWTPTSAIGYLSSEEPLTGDERELTDTQKQKKYGHAPRGYSYLYHSP